MAATIAKNLQKARIGKGLTQAELADLVGITREGIAAYETGRVRLMDDMLIRFAETLNVTTDQILGVGKVNTNKSDLSLRLVKRLQKIENLPPNQQKVLLKNIDMFLKAAESED
jgi:transcriptional regulator with XRE-family HTH domain